MNFKQTASVVAILCGFGIPSAAAQTMAVATADLNVRSGPGPQYDVIGVISADQRAQVDGCIEGSLWCRVTVGGQQGWAYSRYLTAERNGSRVVLSERREAVGVPTVTYETTGRGAAGGAATGAVAGALIGGPIGAAVGGVAGATVGASISPPEEVRTYVRSNPMDPVYLEGEVVVGARLPETVAVREVPSYEYQYVYVNRQPVLVEPGTRRIVYVYR